MHPGMLCEVVRGTLVTSFQDYIRFPLTADQILVMPDEKPPPFSGEHFISVYGNDWSAVTRDANVGLDYNIGVSCTVTYRSTKYPSWKKGDSMYGKVFSGMSSICLRIMEAISQRIAVQTLIATNEEYLTYHDPANSIYNGMMFEYLRFQNCDPRPIPVYADHFSAMNEHQNDVMGESVMGYMMTVNFGEARFGIVLDSQCS